MFNNKMLKQFQGDAQPSYIFAADLAKICYKVDSREMKQDTAKIGINLLPETSGCSNPSYQSENALPGASNTPPSASNPFINRQDGFKWRLSGYLGVAWSHICNMWVGKLSPERRKKASRIARIVQKQLSHSLTVKVDPAQHPR